MRYERQKNIEPPRGAPTSLAAANREMVLVNMGEAKTTRRGTDVLVAHGLGSCIALCMRDPAARVSGMAHVVLPHSPPQGADTGDPQVCARFADIAVPHLLGEMEKEGAAPDRIKIAIVGAAQLLGGEDGKRLDIGSRNTVAVLEALKTCGLRLLAHDVGGTFGRVCQLFSCDGRVLVRTIGSGERELTVLGTKECTK